MQDTLIQKSTKKGRKLLLVIGTAWLFDAMDVALLSFIMPLIKTEWNLTPAQVGYVSSVTSLGMVFGSLLCGYLADKFGRKNVMIVTLIVFSVGNLLLAFTKDVNQFMLVRFITGMGLGGELPVAATMLADNFKGKTQAKMLIMADSFWAIGWILAAVISNTVTPMYGWRASVVVTFFVMMYAFVMRRHLPENYEKKEKTSLKEQFAGIFNHDVIGKTMALSFLWFVVMFSYYGMFLWLPSVLVIRGFSIIHSFQYTLIMSLAQLPGYYLAAWLMGKISHKNILTMYLIGTISSASVFGVASSEWMLLASGAFLSFFNLGAWGALIAFTPSHFKADIRGMGVGFSQSIGRIGATLGPYLIGMLIGMGFGIPVVFGMFVVALILGIIVLAVGTSETY
ncbi:MFS transporter [Companilactobacillus nodensis]|uniref:Transport protein n=1 Tax=Companilactobacillus nodensis DSM 19682 = JCM 14932 = NBRC 107160 TaxID=1423775 RepID=A0A0R1KCV7_9LACO|nr:MFS transporter [Companilactobacillus nodensis]KRK81195.1 transport protein [Companilactobacillus nodensis DSM 19682 = JCM 14932 = NBRC 107160]